MLRKFELRNYKNFKDNMVIDFGKVGGCQFGADCITDNTICKMIIYGKNATGKKNPGKAVIDIVSIMIGFNMISDGMFLNADFKENKALFLYTFKFGDNEVVYKYKSLSDAKLESEELFFDGKQIFKFSFVNREILNCDLDYINPELLADFQIDKLLVHKKGENMNIVNKSIDAGKPFDWGRTSADYARYRDIYPATFYEKIVQRNLCISGQKVLDLGTGTGVLPRNMYHFGAEWIGTDISENQIIQAKRLSEADKLDIQYQMVATEDIDFPDNTFDVITACQCFWYFDHEKVMPKLYRMLKHDGRLLLLYIAWLLLEDKIAGASEELILKYNPCWTGSGETKHPISVSDDIYKFFETGYQEEYDIDVFFTRESWHGRMKACRGVGASLSPEEIGKWETEHKKLLNEIAPEEFLVKHYVAMLELKKAGRK